jgi:FkbM family methyltransferase
MYTVTHGTFRTPRGQKVELSYREDTNDYNTLRSCLDEDEYHLADLYLAGGAIALDIGAHIGGVSIALALDNPECQVVAVEAVPPNADFVRENAIRAGVGDRIDVRQAVAGQPGSVTVSWGWAGNPTAEHHAFVGNAVMPEAHLEATMTEQRQAITLANLVEQYGAFGFAKVDCEGCEFPFLQGPALEKVALIRGEVHSDPADLVSQLILTHEVSVPSVIPGFFEAVRR